jgi:aspartate-semialdehyde dehydrogenase
MKKIKVGVLGATGMVGQRFIQLLEGHPWFEVTEIAASERSANRPYGEVMQGSWSAASASRPSTPPWPVLWKKRLPRRDMW